MSIIIKGITKAKFYKDANKIPYMDVGWDIEELPPHGRLIDADEFMRRAIGTKCFRGDYALMLEELVGESITIISAEEEEE